MVVFSTVAAYPEEFLIPNSTSPDRRFALYAIDANDEYLPAKLEIRRVLDQKSEIEIDDGGYVNKASAYESNYGSEDLNSIFVIWNSTGSRVAMMIRTSKRSGALVVYDRKGEYFQKNSKFPDLFSFAEKKLELNRDGRYSYEFPQSWGGSDQLLVKVHFDDVSRADSKTYQFECTLEFDFGSGKISHFKVLSKTLEAG